MVWTYSLWNEKFEKCVDEMKRRNKKFENVVKFDTDVDGTVKMEIMMIMMIMMMITNNNVWNDQNVNNIEKIKIKLR